MGYRLIERGGKCKAELRREKNGKREMRRLRKCVEGGESSNRMREGECVDMSSPARAGKSQIWE